MGLLKLLTFPISGPMVAGRWVCQTLLDEAERQYYDESAIAEQMAQVERDRELGRLAEASFERVHEQLFERLLEARARRQQS